MNTTQKIIKTGIMLTVICYLVFSPAFMAPKKADAYVLNYDVTLNPLMYQWTKKDLKIQSEAVRGNVQKQTAPTIADGNAPPVPTGFSSAIGTLVGLISGIPGTLVAGVANFKTMLKALVKNIISKILQDVTAWAKQGFHGKPNFVKDWKGLLEASALDASSELIKSIPILSKFCSPASVMGSKPFFNTALSQGKSTFSKYVQKEFKPNSKCTLETVFNNIENAPGDFKKSIDKMSKSWDKKGGSVMAPALMSPSTNMLGAYFVAKDESMGRVVKKTEAKTAEATANGGYLNISDGCVGGSGSGSAQAPMPGPDARLPAPGIGGPGGTGTCGNGIRNAVNANGWPEQCDGSDLAGPVQCARFSKFQSGTLGCRPDCNYDYSGCVANAGTGNPITGEKFCPGVMAGNYVKESLGKTGLGQFSDMIDMNDMNDLFATTLSQIVAGLTDNISSYISSLVGQSLKKVSM